MVAQKVNIAFSSDANFVGQLTVSAASAVCACRGSSACLAIHVLDCGLGPKGWTFFEDTILKLATENDVQVCLKRHVIDMRIFENCPTWTNGSKAAWSRLCLPDLLPDEDVCVYSDCDVLFVKSPECVQTELLRGQSWIVGHRNPNGEAAPDLMWCRKNGVVYDKENYVCSGLVGMNLKALRRIGLLNAAREFLAQHPGLRAFDQVAINVICRDHVSLLRSGFGLFTHECYGYRGEIGAIHYSGGTPWASVKNAYDWICVSQSAAANRIWNDFMCQVVGLSAYVRPPIAFRHKVSGMVILGLCRLLSCFHGWIPGHKTLSELTEAYRRDDQALREAYEKVMEIPKSK